MKIKFYDINNLTDFNINIIKNLYYHDTEVSPKLASLIIKANLAVAEVYNRYYDEILSKKQITPQVKPEHIVKRVHKVYGEVKQKPEKPEKTLEPLTKEELFDILLDSFNG